MRASEPIELGAGGLRISRLGLGSAALGNLFQPVAEDEAVACVRRSLELGLRQLDTAPLYGYGLAEERLGRALRGRERGTYVLSTKVGRVLVAGDGGEDALFPGTSRRARFDFSRDAVLRTLAASLERLGSDRADIVFVHDPDAHVDAALAGALPALVDLREQGALAAVGVGTTDAAVAARFVREGGVDCVLVAGRCTLLDRSALDDLLPLCAREGVPVIAAGVYNSGILADPERQPRFDYAPAPQELRRRAGRLAAVCARHGLPLAAAAIQFPLRQPAVVSVLSGGRSVAELEENVRLFEQPLPAELWAELDATAEAV